MRLAVLFSLCLLVAACEPDNGKIHGYVEGEFVLVSPSRGGILKTLPVERGQKVQAGDRLFSLDLIQLEAERDSADAELGRAQAQLADLAKGERPEDLEITRKQKEQAQATLVNAQKEYNRLLPLTEAGTVSRANLDKAKASYDAARAHVEELNAKLKSAAMGARVDQISAAQASVTMAEQNLVRAAKQLQEAAPLAPAAGTIEDTYFRPGEYVAAGVPVVSLLPPENVKIRFYAPQAIVPSLSPGQSVKIDCDGCASPITAKISFISEEAEYTPPVIYSVESRDKLVFLVEAKPDAFHESLRPGLPVDVTLEKQ